MGWYNVILRARLREPARPVQQSAVKRRGRRHPSMRHAYPEIPRHPYLQVKVALARQRVYLVDGDQTL
ncbi:hypothetical protein [Lactiplantibacillus garii]|uniref:hypothetical protein n=1 Tax=Lactiplantibacillus garii TaxID=2306423 RepID=UPI000F62A6D9|nr:hypothetical protein [Lactiplantibacillus garii]